MSRFLSLLLGFYLLIINIFAFAAFGIDKKKARRGQWRIQESTLLGLSAAGGFVGAMLGMKVFHHKTRKPKFTVGVPLTAIVWIAAAVLLWRSGWL